MTATPRARAEAGAAAEAWDEIPGRTWAAGCCDLLDVAADWTTDETPWNSRRLDTDTVFHLNQSTPLILQRHD